MIDGESKPKCTRPYLLCHVALTFYVILACIGKAALIEHSK